MKKSKSVAAFNSPFELGVRMVYLLNSLQPIGADLQKLVLLDYAIVYSDDIRVLRIDAVSTDINTPIAIAKTRKAATISIRLKPRARPCMGGKRRFI